MTNEEGNGIGLPGATSDVDARIRRLMASGDDLRAANEAVRAFGSEVLGFLVGVVGSEADADEIFAAVSERLWRSLPAFEWRCSLRTWVYVLARREAMRFRRGARRHLAGRVRLSEVADVVAEVRTTPGSSQGERLTRLRDELPPKDRELLILRVDRGLAWDEIALAFVRDPEHCPEDERRRAVVRMRKRFQILKQRLVARAREEEGLWSE